MKGGDSLPFSLSEGASVGRMPWGGCQSRFLNSYVESSSTFSGWLLLEMKMLLVNLTEMRNFLADLCSCNPGRCYMTAVASREQWLCGQESSVLTNCTMSWIFSTTDIRLYLQVFSFLGLVVLGIELWARTQASHFSQSST